MEFEARKDGEPVSVEEVDPHDLDVVVNGSRFVRADQVEALNMALARLQVDFDQTVGWLSQSEEKIRNLEETLEGREQQRREALRALGGHSGEIIHGDANVPWFAVDAAMDPVEQPDDGWMTLAQVDPPKKKKRGRIRKLFFEVAIPVGIIAVGAYTVFFTEDPPPPAEVAVVSPGPVSAADNIRLSWEDTGADSYDVEVFSGGRLTETRSADSATLEVELAPGSYQWVVYEVRGGERESEAIVNSLLTVK